MDNKEQKPFVDFDKATWGKDNPPKFKGSLADKFIKDFLEYDKNGFAPIISGGGNFKTLPESERRYVSLDLEKLPKKHFKVKSAVDGAGIGAMDEVYEKILKEENKDIER